MICIHTHTYPPLYYRFCNIIMYYLYVSRCLFSGFLFDLNVSMSCCVYFKMFFLRCWKIPASTMHFNVSTKARCFQWSGSSARQCSKSVRWFRIWVFLLPIGSMYGIFTYIWHKNQLNVGKYNIHGSYGFGKDWFVDLVGVERFFGVPLRSWTSFLDLPTS